MKHEGLENASDVAFYDLNIRGEELYDRIKELKPKATYIVFCMNNDEEALIQALMASEKITDTPILVNVSENYHLASQLEGDHSRFDNIHIF